MEGPLTKLEGMLQGEEVHVKTYATFHSRNGPFVGTFYLSNFRILFVRHLEALQNSLVHIRNADTHVQLGKIFKISKYVVLQDTILEIVCKDFQLARFSFINEGNKFDKLFKTLNKLAFPPTIDKSFAFQFKMLAKEESGVAETYDGWKVYDPVQEYERLGIPDENWRVSTYNQFYKLCSSYPRVLVVPNKITDAQLKESAQFRLRERIPVLSWRHPGTKAALTRSSQPRVGWGRTRSPADEELIAGIRLANPSYQNLPLIVMDARTKIDAVANQAMGAGSEGTYYENTKLQYLGICNASRVQEAASRLLQLVHSEDSGSGSDWLQRLSNTRWLDYISLIIAGSVRIMRALDQGYSVHVHCSDGWDRTVQLVTLTMLLSDPYYRTISGFAVLVEKEWLSLGHKFEDRLGHASIDHDSKERSPIFIQWVDCVYQLVSQFPTAFEFNEHFMISLIDAVMSLQYGTFLCDSERSRVLAMISERTISFWTEVHINKHTYTNVYYKSHQGMLLPASEMRYLRFWTDYYLRWSMSSSSLHLELGEWDAKLLQTAQDKQKLQQVLSQSNTANEELKQQIFSLANDKVKMDGEVTTLYQKLDSLLDLLTTNGDTDLLTRAQTVIETECDGEDCGPREIDDTIKPRNSRSTRNSTNGINTTEDGSIIEKKDSSNISISTDGGYNDSGYYSDQEETSDSSTNYKSTSSDFGVKRRVLMGRSISVGPIGSILESKLARSNSEGIYSKDTEVSGDVNNCSNNVHTTNDNNNHIKNHFRSMITKSLNSSDDNEYDERENENRNRHSHHHGARRWRHIIEEKNNLQEENNKLKETNEELTRKLKEMEKLLESEREFSRRVAASKKSLINDLTNISYSAPLNIQCVDTKAAGTVVDEPIKEEPVDYLGDNCVLGGSDVRVFPDYTAIHRERCEIDLVSVSDVPDRWCAGCDTVLKGGQFLMVRVAGKSLPHCKQCAQALVSLTQRNSLCYACGRALDASPSSPPALVSGDPHCLLCTRRVKHRSGSLVEV